jgi:hypothetical protein
MAIECPLTRYSYAQPLLNLIYHFLLFLIFLS